MSFITYKTPIGFSNPKSNEVGKLETYLSALIILSFNIQFKIKICSSVIFDSHLVD